MALTTKISAGLLYIQGALVFAPGVLPFLDPSDGVRAHQHVPQVYGLIRPKEVLSQMGHLGVADSIPRMLTDTMRYRSRFDGHTLLVTDFAKLTVADDGNVLFTRSKLSCHASASANNERFLATVRRICVLAEWFKGPFCGCQRTGVGSTEWNDGVLSRLKIG